VCVYPRFKSCCHSASDCRFCCSQGLCCFLWERKRIDEMWEQSSNTKAIGFVAEPWDKNLYRWHVSLHPPSDSELYKDLKKLTKKSIFSKKSTEEPCIELEMLFPCEYPNGSKKNCNNSLSLLTVQKRSSFHQSASGLSFLFFFFFCSTFCSLDLLFVLGT
jgi:hypothetical protein